MVDSKLCSEVPTVVYAPLVEVEAVVYVVDLGICRLALLATDGSKVKVWVEGSRNSPSFDVMCGVGSLNSEHVLSVEATGCLSTVLEAPNRNVFDIGNTEASSYHGLLV